LEMPKTCLIVCVVRISGDLLFVIIMCFYSGDFSRMRFI